MALTLKRVDKLLNAGARGRHHDGNGLYLCVSATKAGNWSRRYELNHKAHWLGLGSARTFTLDEARERNREVSKLLADGIDPLQRRQADRAEQAAATMKARTFEQCAQEYISRHQSEWKSAEHGRQWQDSLRRFVFPRIGHLPIAAIDKPLILGVLEQPIVGDKRHPASGKFWDARTTTADRVRNRLELVINFAIAAEYRPDGPNPASWSGLKDLLAAPTKSAAKKHHAALPYVEAPAFLKDLRRQEGISARALEFLLLTAARVAEVRGARWDEIDMKAKMWTVPAERMKAGKEHRVPLSDQAVDLLAALPRSNGFVFFGARGEKLGETVMSELLRQVRQGVTTIHGLRSTFSDWAHETTAFPNHVIEMSLAHTIGSDVEKAYRRGDLLDKRRKLMEAWATYCASPAASADVVPLRAR
jgi:integrase